MIVNLKIPDSLYDEYLTRFGSPAHWARMKEAIEAFLPIPKGERVLLLHGDARKAIEAIFQTTLDSPEKLLRLIRTMNQVKIHGVEINFDESELTRIATQATFHGRSTEVFIKEMVTEIKDRMLERV
jgi:hypothetical protein